MSTTVSQDFIGRSESLKKPVRGGTPRPGVSLLALILTCGGSLASAAPPVVDRLTWDQYASSLATAQGYRYALVVDGGAATPLTDVKCVGSSAPFTCSVLVPELPPGTHNLAVTAAPVLANVARDPSPPSVPLLTVTLHGVTIACPAPVPAPVSSATATGSAR
jgi:hypothetical protein